jgi:hypothetical protein
MPISKYDAGLKAIEDVGAANHHKLIGVSSHNKVCPLPPSLFPPASSVCGTFAPPVKFVVPARCPFLSSYLVCKTVFGSIMFVL